ncbi:MAG TPA: hypothetical protein PKI57_05815 [Myxococcota bacterium]|nr:hypothetical protein [Myxococcota bacterium]
MDRASLFSIRGLLVATAAFHLAACGADQETPDVLQDVPPDIATDTPAADGAQQDGADDAGAGFNQVATPWKPGPAAPESDLFDDMGLVGFNRWVQEVQWQFEGDEPVVNHDALAYFAVGNGRTFSFLGTDYPLTVLHEVYGPDYDRPDLETFSDIRFMATVNREPQKVQTSRIGRFSRSSIVGITNVGQDLKVSAVFAAPMAGDTKFDTSLVAVFRIENTGSTPIPAVGLAMKAKSGFEQSAEGAVVIQRDLRRIWTICPDAEWNPDSRTFEITAGTLEPGARRDVTFWMFLTDGEPAVDPTPYFRQVAAEADTREVLSATDSWWKEWFNDGLQIEIGDPMVTDLLESFLYTVKSQIGHNGAMTPLSHYGEYWTRDLSGAARLFAIGSRPDELKAMLDYHHVAACANQGFFNASKVNWPLGVPCAVTDWSSLPVMTEKTAAEAPSYVVHMYHRLFDATGDDSLMREREQMLRYGLQKQAMNAEFLLPFSDDETFRPAMAMNLGIGGPETMFATLAWSLHSTLLYVAAADGLARALGYQDGDDIIQLRDNVAATIESRYWQQAEGFFAPILYMSDLSPHMVPYEDVNLTASWMNMEDFLGWDRVRSDVDVLAGLAWLDEPGIIQTNAGAFGELLGYDLSQGLATGMTPGFSLYALSRHRQDLAQKNFNAFRNIPTASGNVTEDFATKGFRPLMPAYDDTGEFGEIWARFRPWEGGQDAEAIIFYLTGLWPDAAGRRVTLHPHIPNNLPGATYRGLLAAGCGIDMKLAEMSDATREYELKFTGGKCAGLDVTLKTATWMCGETDTCEPFVSASGCDIDATAAGTGIARFTADDGMTCTFLAELIQP